MKLIVITLLIAVAATSIFAIAGHFYRLSPTPGGMWLVLGKSLFVLNFPGFAVAILAHSVIGWSGRVSSDFPSLVLCALGDWLGYFGVAKLALFLKHKISSHG
ncbi:MAG: hypothetical protein WA188_18060 [Terriglobales bacterium]